MFAAFLTTILFSISAVSANRSARIMGGTEANFWRLCVATLLLGLWAHNFGPGLGGDAFPFFLLSGAIGFGLGDLALFQALPRLGSRLSMVLVHCLAAPLAALIEWIWLGTTLSAAQLLAGLVILGGVALALAPGGHLQLTLRTAVPGILFGATAAFGQGLGAVLSRKANRVADLAGQNIDGLTAAYQRILAGLAIGAVFLLLVKRHSVRDRFGDDAEGHAAAAGHAADKWRRGAGWMTLNALAGPTLGVGCFQWALKTTPTGVVLPIVAATPLMVIPFAHYLEGERPTRRSLVGGVIAVLGVIAMTWFSVRR